VDPQTARKAVIDDMRVVYAHAWTQFAFIKAEDARTHAINGVMITIDKVWPFLAPKDPAPETPAAAPVAAPAAKPAAAPVPTPPAPPKAAEGPVAPATKPVKAAPPKPAPPVQQPLPAVSGTLPAYDRVNLRWNHCDEMVSRDGKIVECGNTELDAESDKIGRDGKPYTKHYQACFQCGMFLNADGKKVPMKPRQTPS
jgi:hypothetical protein